MRKTIEVVTRLAERGAIQQYAIAGAVAALNYIQPTLTEDLYVVLAGQDEDTGKAVVEVFVNPLVAWVWIGGVVMLLGTLLAMIPSRVEREMAEVKRPSEEAVEEKHVF